MGQFSYKKRKGTTKQSFKNRKKEKKSGGTITNENANATTTDASAATTSEKPGEKTVATTTTPTDASLEEYTANVEGYNKFIAKVKTDPNILETVVYVNNQMEKIFLKKNDNWVEIKKRIEIKN